MSMLSTLDQTKGRTNIRTESYFFPKASLMLGFCFRFSLKVPGSDTSCDDGDKKGFPFRCAADRACDAGWGCRPGVRGWLGGRRCGAGWWDGGVVQTGCARLARERERLARS